MDYTAMVDVFREARVADGTGWEMTAKSVDADVRAFGSVPERTMLIAEIDGQVIGWARAYDFGFATDDGRMLNHSGHVLPAWRRRGIGRALLGGVQAELAHVRSSRSDPSGSSAGFHTWIFASNQSARTMLEADGYRPLRYVVEMTRSLADLPAIELPDGLSTRPVGALDRAPVLRALNDAMQDHHGWPEMSDDQMALMFDHPVRGQFDVWQVAWCGDRVVGGVLGYVDADENLAMDRRRGYTEGIFTVRDWRGRGVASALITQNLRLLRDRGMTEAALSVDTENPTGALVLYERHGFREVDRVIVYRRELEPAP
ncbi:MAG: GNAT family N-acetyltransferase [Chloroflexi bacterium]|nr:GNAT family N-acetyltransferase [Chloroflexota bacterium]